MGAGDIWGKEWHHESGCCSCKSSNEVPAASCRAACSPPPPSHRFLLCCEMPGAALPRVTCNQVPRRLVRAQPPSSTLSYRAALAAGLQAGSGSCVSLTSLQASGKLRHGVLRTLLKPIQRYKPIQGHGSTKRCSRSPFTCLPCPAPRGSRARCFLGAQERGMPGSGHSGHSSLLSRPAGCTQPCPASSSPNKAFLFSLRNLLQLEWNQRDRATFQMPQPEFSHLLKAPHHHP